MNELKAEVENSLEIQTWLTICKNICWQEHCFITKLLNLKLFLSVQAKEAEWKFASKYDILLSYLKHKSITIIN